MSEVQVHDSESSRTRVQFDSEHRNCEGVNDVLACDHPSNRCVDRNHRSYVCFKQPDFSSSELIDRKHEPVELNLLQVRVVEASVSLMSCALDAECRFRFVFVVVQQSHARNSDSHKDQRWKDRSHELVVGDCFLIAEQSALAVVDSHHHEDS